MALGTITLVEQVAAQGPIFYDRLTIVGDTSYTTGGTVAFTASLQAVAGMEGKEIVGLWVENGQGGTVFDNDLFFDHTTDTLVATVLSTAAEVGNAVNLSGSTFSVLVASK